MAGPSEPHRHLQPRVLGDARLSSGIPRPEAALGLLELGHSQPAQPCKTTAPGAMPAFATL